MVARKDDAIVDALIHRLQRDECLSHALSIRNFQHQVIAHTSHAIPCREMSSLFGPFHGAIAVPSVTRCRRRRRRRRGH